MIETPKSIAEWSGQVFPTLDKDAQLEKLVEETREYMKAKSDEERIKELADIYIVASILKERFDCKLGWDMFQGIFTLKMTGVYKAVDEKMKINRARKWAWNGKTYHHEENDE